MNTKTNGSDAASLRFRRFKPDDAEFCCETRHSAYIHEFTGELSKREIAAAMNAYSLADYKRMAERMPFFIAQTNNERLGFFTLKRLDTCTAEIPLIYISLNNIGAGIGSACITFIEQWISENWSDVKKLIVDTIIPNYNSGFYKKVGFTPDKEIFCEFGGLKVKALRLIRKLKTCE